MKRIKQIIESFLTIGRDPTGKEIRAAWAEVLQQAMEMQRKGDKPATDSEAKS